VQVTFYGVRGSCPCPSDANRRYGGNTACVALTLDGEAPILLDLGTGLRSYGGTQPVDGSFRATALLTHAHWDHVQGFPFFAPVDRVGAEIDIYGPGHLGASLEEVFDGFMRPPYFPIRCAELRGDIRFHDVGDEDFALGDAKIKARPVPHTGPTVGYQVRWGGATITYIPDHQAPPDLATFAQGALDLAEGVDVLIHDAQYTPVEFAEKAHWGHCTVDYAVALARRSGVAKLVLFHHDPGHDDEQMDALVARAQSIAGPDGPQVIGAYEGLQLSL
jgi:phosphoribosyl 1,2-cyclic phosphodiesterase